MNEDLCLRTLAKVLDWSNDRARAEYEWLRLMSRFKYDGYRDFVAGVRFLECLITWLTQFQSPEERQAAYDFLKKRLVYVGPAELTKLVELFYFETVRPTIAAIAAAELGVKRHCLWSHPKGLDTFARSLRHVLFMGLSDGARTDMLRYAARGDLTNEQVVGFTQIDPDKWLDLLKDLRKDTENEGARFHHLFVLDDFTASSTSLLRKPPDSGHHVGALGGLWNSLRGKPSGGAQWKGKLVRLWNSLEHTKEKLGEDPMADGWTLCVHHYLATPRAKQAAFEREQQAARDRGKNWFRSVEFSFSAVLDSSIEVTDASDPDFLGLTDTYYDSSIEPEKHLRECGIDDLKRGYAACSLPVILEHNTPNNSLALLWAESRGENGPAMRPSFSTPPTAQLVGR